MHNNIIRNRGVPSIEKWTPNPGTLTSHPDNFYVQSAGLQLKQYDTRKSPMQRPPYHYLTPAAAEQLFLLDALANSRFCASPFNFLV